MVVEVPRFRRTPSTRDILATRPVGATDWGEMSRQANWLKGQPRCLVPDIIHSDAFSDRDDLKMALRFYPSGYHHTRRWSVRAVGTGTVDYYIESSGLPAAPSLTPGLTGSLSPIRPWTYVEELASLPTAMTAVDVDFRFVVGESDSWRLGGLSCWEVPHPFLTDSEGQPTSGIVSGQPVAAGEVSILRSAAADMLIGHRMLGAYAVPYATGAGAVQTTYAASTTSGSFVDLWDDPIPVLPRNTTQDPGGNTSVYADIFAWVDSGQAEIRLNNPGSSGSTSSATTISATTPTWVTSESLTTESEDLSSATGMASGPTDFELVDLQGRVTTANTLYVASAILYEPTS